MRVNGCPETHRRNESEKAECGRSSDTAGRVFFFFGRDPRQGRLVGSRIAGDPSLGCSASKGRGGSGAWFERPEVLV